MTREVPAIIEEMGLPFHWDETKVWAVKAPSQLMPFSTLAWHLKVPFLHSVPDGYYDLAPQAVLDCPHKYPQEYARAIDSDLRYPLDVMHHDNHWVILDGLHRLMKYHIFQREIVKVRKIPLLAIPDIQSETP